MTPTTRSRILAGALLLLVASTGFVTGMITERYVVAGRAGAPPGGPMMLRTERTTVIRVADSVVAIAGAPRVLRLRLPEQLARDLELTRDQQARIEAILAEDQAALRALMDSVEPSITAIIESSRSRILQVLTPEQIRSWRGRPIRLDVRPFDSMAIPPPDPPSDGPGGR